MKLGFPVPTDDQMHRYCLQCMNEGVGRELRDGERVYPCPTCGHVGKRTIYFDTHKAWLEPDNELWHESIGTFVRNDRGEYLFFLRNEFPRQLAIPAGHLERDKDPGDMARTELEEETGLQRAELTHLLSVDIHGDSCSAGADVHRWNVYGTNLRTGESIALGNESAHEPLWLTQDEALKRNLVPSVFYLLRVHASILDER